MSNLKKFNKMKKTIAITMLLVAMVLFCIDSTTPEGFTFQVIAYVAGVILLATGAYLLNKKEARQ